jgi:multicomponent Na+:H+ antiporter subunit B
MRLGDSIILKTTLRKIFPFILLFSFYIFSYGAVFPGGGFQAGVVAGTIILVYRIIFRKRRFGDYFYKVLELCGAGILFLFLIGGIFYQGNYFIDLYNLTATGNIFSNIYIFMLNFAVFLEVAGSIVLIFRFFVDWSEDEENI